MFQSKVGSNLSRGYATVSKIVTTPGGVKVATAGGSESPLASVSLVLNAGSRFEGVETAGAAHYLKAFGFRNTGARTSFRTIREAELNGATLHAEATRENVTFSVRCFKEAVPYFVEVLGDVAAGTKFTEHEFRDVDRLVKFETLSARANPVTRVLEGVHQAAFRQGLGNSLYAPDASPITTGDAVRQYAERALNGRVALVGTGIEAEELSKLAAASRLGALGSNAASAAATSAAAQFVGGGQQVYETAGDVAHYALAFSCAPEQAALLRGLLGGGRRVKWGQGVAPLAQLAAREGFSAEPFACTYSDAGLVGVVVEARATQLRDAVQKVAAAIQRDVARPQTDAVQRAVAAARLDAADALATGPGAVRSLAQIALGQAAPDAVDSAASSLAATASSVFASKPVAASVGLSQSTPYVDTLGF
ncbi:ubiquinol-cytochrome c reductase core subunit 1 [Coemansia sp. RSA 552]|nr:ubiquinol-cytochrome c reductase core subunit 1 [Coemansia sp. RSA 552]